MNPIFNTTAAIEQIEGVRFARKTYTVFGFKVLSTVMVLG
jgi:hypothetical protein